MKTSIPLNAPQYHANAASIRARLLNLSRTNTQARRGGAQSFNNLLTRYALERLLYRLSASAYAERFLLKGALLFDLWFDIPHRPTRDMDLMGMDSTLADSKQVTLVFKALCNMTATDGLHFDAASIHTQSIRKQANQTGIRLDLLAWLDGARCTIQVDIGFGDAVTPEPEWAQYPVLLPDQPAPQLRVYPRHTVVAEKLEAMVQLGMSNSRMKDYYDLWVLRHGDALDLKLLQQAIAATFDARGTPIPVVPPLGLTQTFACDAPKNTQWKAFLTKNQLTAPDLAHVVGELNAWLWPVLNRLDSRS